MISYSRGKFRILNIDLIDQNGCECSGAVRDHYQEMFGAFGGGVASASRTGVTTRLTH
jgi:hypothetical protein